MEIVYKKVADLIPYAGNPRKNDHAIKDAAAIIKRFGFRVPLLIKDDNEVVDGHLRLKAADALKMEAVPCVVVDDLSDADVRALRISVNKLAEKAKWDSELLDIEIGDLKGLGFSLLDLGFDAGEEVVGIDREGQERSGASPWERVGEKDKDTVLFSFGVVTVNVPIESYELFASHCPEKDPLSFILEMINEITSKHS